MKSMVFDTGPIISLTVNNLLWLLEPLQKRFKGEFYITKAIEAELIKRPLESKRFKFEALQVLQHIRNGNLRVVGNSEIHSKALRLLSLANQSFKAYNHYISIVSYAEMEVLAAALHLDSSALVVDERTTRVLVERPLLLRKILGRKLHTHMEVHNGNIREFQKEAKIRVLRSVELVTIAYEMGLLDEYIAEIPNPRRTLLESVLWGVKLNGCAVSVSEIEEILRLEVK